MLNRPMSLRATSKGTGKNLIGLVKSGFTSWKQSVPPGAHGHKERGEYLNKSRVLSTVRMKKKWKWSRQPTVSYMVSLASYLPHIESKKCLHENMRHIQFFPTGKQSKVSASSYIQL